MRRLASSFAQRPCRGVRTRWWTKTTRMLALRHEISRLVTRTAGNDQRMVLIVLLVVVMIVAAIAIAAGALDRPRRARRVVVTEAPREVVVERAVERPVQRTVTERTVTTDRDPLL